MVEEERVTTVMKALHARYRGVGAALLCILLLAGCTFTPSIEGSARQQFEAFVAHEPLVARVNLDWSTEGDPLEPIKIHQYTLTTAPGAPASELKSLSRELTDWITENVASPRTRILVNLLNGATAIGLSPINKANETRIDIVETALESGSFSQVWLRATWQTSSSVDNGYSGVSLWVSPAATTTPGSALVAADTLLKASGLSDSTTFVVNGDLEDHFYSPRGRALSSVATYTTDALPDGTAECVNALFADPVIAHFSVSLPATTSGNTLVVAEGKILDVQESLARLGCDAILAPVNYESK